MTAYDCTVTSHENVTWKCAVTINDARGGYNATCNAEKALDAALHKCDPDIAAAFDWAFRRAVAMQANVAVLLTDKFCNSKTCPNGLHASTCTPHSDTQHFTMMRCAGVRSEYRCVYKMTPQRALVCHIERGTSTSSADFASTTQARSCAQLQLPQPRRATLAMQPEMLQPVPPGADYKTKLCRNFSTASGCQFGTDCVFAHGNTELRTAAAAAVTAPAPKSRPAGHARTDSGRTMQAAAAASSGCSSSTTSGAATGMRFTVHSGGCNPHANDFTPRQHPASELDAEIALRETPSHMGVHEASDGASASSTPPAPPKLTLCGPARQLSAEEQRWLLQCLQRNTSSLS